MKGIDSPAKPCLAAALALLVSIVSGEDWIKQLTQENERGTLSDKREQVRGDSGKWNDEPILQHAVSPQKRPQGQSLDDWADTLPETSEATAADENWLIFRTRQLDDNDRVWIERIEQKGNRFEVIARQATWSGTYKKNFTYYQLLAVNLGKQPAGTYEVVWKIAPANFSEFEDPKDQNPNTNPRKGWPVELVETNGSTAVLTLSFTVK